MEIRQLDHDAPPYDPEQVVAAVFMEGAQSNARVIRLSPGQSLPPHTHGASELMLFVVEGEGRIGPDDAHQPFTRGSLARLSGEEELRVTNTGTSGLTLLAVLSPPFPPR
jgi:quercetin dioxygenase-like cupin family protein